MGSIQAQYECIRVLSETEFYDDLAMIDVPVVQRAQNVIARAAAIARRSH